MDFKLAWRNIWRNPRRTAVILVAVVIGVWSMVFLGGLMRGIGDGMVHNGINTLTGHILIQQTNYPDDPSVDHRITDAEAIAAAVLKQLPEGSHTTARVRVSAVANNARHNAGVTLVGIDPRREVPVSFIGSAVTQGDYLDSDDQAGILIGRALAEQFETDVGRKLILMSQGTNGEVISRAFRIRGLYDAEMTATEKIFVFVTLSAAQQMLGMKNSVSEISIILPSHRQAHNIAGIIRTDIYDRDVVIRSWQQVMPLLMAHLDLYDTFMFIWYLVVFIAMGFGIVNTTLMAVFERMHEFGLLKALGMRPRRIVKNILNESFLILIFGMFGGNVLGIVFCRVLSIRGIDLSALAQGAEYFGMTRIIFPRVWINDLFTANIVVLALGLLISLYPAVKAARFTPVEAMTHN